ncbi:MAG TPA: 1,4-beta-xylanase [Rikenellaceae bacterium]|nr:1,4-beta-xylanase [Rikenellaceae bacterium]
MKRIVLLACAVLAFGASAFAQPGRTMKMPDYPKPDLVVELWPDGAPNSNGITKEEFDYGNHVTNVTRPTLSIFLPKGPCNGLAIISCPGGGYVDVWDKTEGFSLAPWYNEMGIVYAVLKYRLPNGHKEVPISDVHKAFSIMRERASEYGFKWLGVQGNSAGGHLAAWASTDYSNKVERPDFSVLFYPVITMDSSFTHLGSQHYLLGDGASEELCAEYSAEKRVNSDTPPAFLMHCTDDNLVPVRNSLEYYEALVRNAVNYSSMYIMPVGGHGWTDRQFEYRDAWMTALKTWLLELPKVLK